MIILYLKRLKSPKFVRVKVFPMYGGIGVSAPSLHRESTDSLITRMYTFISETSIIKNEVLCRDGTMPKRRGNNSR